MDKKLLFMKLYLSVFFYFLGLLSASSQQTIIQPRDIFIHFDKSLYFNGEKVWLAVYTVEKKEADLVQIQLINPALKIIDNQLLELHQGSAGTCLSLPDTLAAGYYYVKVNRVSDMSYNRIYALPVLNENQKKDSLLRMNLPEIFLPSESNFPALITVSWDNKTEFQQREIAEIAFQVMDDTGRPLESIYSVAITDNTGILKEFTRLPETSWLQNAHTSAQAGVDKLIFKGQWKQGTIPPAGFSFLAFNDVAADRLYPVLPDSGGFKIVLDRFYGSRDFQLINWNPFESFHPEFETEHPGDELVGFLKGRLTNLPFPVEYFDRHIKKKFLDSLLFVNTTKEVVRAPEILQFEKSPDKIYQLKDYEYVKDFTSFFRDAVASSSLVKTDTLLSLRLFSKSRANELTNKPLYQVDGYYMADENIFLNYLHPADTMEIRLFTEPKTIKQYFTPNLTGNGIVSLLHSNIKNIKARKQVSYTTINGITPASLFQQPDKPVSVPFLDSQVYWQSGITTDEQGRGVIRCLMPDALTDLTITVCGISNSGIPFKASRNVRINLR